MGPLPSLSIDSQSRRNAELLDYWEGNFWNETRRENDERYLGGGWRTDRYYTANDLKTELLTHEQRVTSASLNYPLLIPFPTPLNKVRRNEERASRLPAVHGSAGSFHCGGDGSWK